MNDLLDSRDESPPVVFHRDLMEARGYPSASYSAIANIFLPSRAEITVAMRQGYNRAVLDALQSNNTGAIQAMLDAGLDPNSQDKSGVTLLHKACHMALAPVVRLLLLHGANVRCSDESGKTPLHDLCWMGSLYPDGSEEIATMLLSQDESLLRAGDRLGCTPLEYLRPSQYAAWKTLLQVHCDDWWPIVKK